MDELFGVNLELTYGKVNKFITRLLSLAAVVGLWLLVSYFVQIRYIPTLNLEDLSLLLLASTGVAFKILVMFLFFLFIPGVFALLAYNQFPEIKRNFEAVVRLKLKKKNLSGQGEKKEIERWFENTKIILYSFFVPVFLGGCSLLVISWCFYDYEESVDVEGSGVYLLMFSFLLLVCYYYYFAYCKS